MITYSSTDVKRETHTIFVKVTNEREKDTKSSVKIVSKEKLARGFGNVCEKVRYMKFIGKLFIELNCTEKNTK